MKIHKVAQNSPEWHALRLGIITASSIGDLFTSKGQLADNETSRSLINRLAMERISGRPSCQFSNRETDRGHEMEPLARAEYEKWLGRPVQQVGFVTNQINDIVVGCSPDLLVDHDGMGEIKSRSEAVYFKELMKGELPAEHLPQIQFALMVTGRKWCAYVGYCDGWPLIIRDVQPDSAWFAKMADAVEYAERKIAETINQYKLAADGFPMTEKIPEAVESELT